MTATTITGMVPVLAPIEVQAAVTKTANRNEVNVSVDGKVSKLVAYNIDGYNYFRAADIAKALNFALSPYKTLVPKTKDTYINGVLFQTQKPFTGTVEAAPTQASLTVTMVPSKIYMDIISRDSDAINIVDRNYFKLQDIAMVSEVANGLKAQSVKLTLDFDQTTNTIIIVKGDTTAPSPSTTSNVQPMNLQPLLTAPPEVMSVPGNILKDPEKGAVLGNYTFAYSIHPMTGECTWYAIGRFYETSGIDTTESKYGNQLSNVQDDYWLDATEKSKNLKAVRYLGNDNYSNMPNRGIAVWETHVTFVEYVERDAKGNPLYIFYTEGNSVGDRKYVPTRDGTVRKMAVTDMKYQGGGKFIGWVILPEWVSK